MSFRRYGGVNYNAKNNIVKSNYNTSTNLSVTGNIGQDNSYINFLSDISGHIIIHGDIDISGNLDVSGNAHIGKNLDVSGNAYIVGDLDVAGNENLSGNLHVYSNELIDGLLDVLGNLNVNSNAFISGNLDVNGNLHAYSNVLIDENLDVSGNENISGDLLVYGTSILEGQVYTPSGITGGTGSFTNINISGPSFLNGQVYAPGGITGPTGSYNNIYVSGPSLLNGQVYAPGGIIGGTGSFSNINVSGPSLLNGQVYAPGGITGATGSYNNIYVSGPSLLNGQVYAPGGIIGGTGSFSNINVSGPSLLNDQVYAPGGITGGTGSFDNLFVYHNTDVCGNLYGANLYGAYMYLTATNQDYSIYPSNSVVPKSYVDTIGSGLKPGGSVICVTSVSIGGPGDVVPSGIPVAADTDGYQVQAGDYVLVICQNAGNGGNLPAPAPSSAVNNGVWIVSAGAWSRPSSGTFTTGTNAVGAFTFVRNGNTYDNDALVQINNPAIIGTNPLLFTILYQVKFQLGQGLNIQSNILSVDPSLNFINYLDSTPGEPNASGTLTLGSYSSNVIIGPTGPSSYPIIMQAGVAGPAASFNNGSFTNLNVSGLSNLNGLISAPAGITGTTGSFSNINVSGISNLNGLISAPAGITGATGSFSNLNVSGRSNLNGLISAPAGITGATGSFSNLYINGDAYVNGNINSKNLLLQGDNTNAYVRPINASSNLYLGANNLNYLTITSSGNVGIGTTSPAYRLDVSGNINVSNNTRSLTFTTTSDYRIKTNIQQIYKTIDYLKPITYYNEQSKKQDMGFIAHEVQEEFPFLVEGEKDGENMQSLNYNGLIALLVKEVQDLKKENKEILIKLENMINR
jgi:cytoskeletal protein CcmA (bactofilin family)